MAGMLLDKAAAGEICVFGGLVINRDTILEQLEETWTSEGKHGDTSRASVRMSVIIEKTPSIAASYLPPIIRAKYGRVGGAEIGDSQVGSFVNEYRRVVVAFVSLPGLFKASTRPKGLNIPHLNDVYSALKTILNKFEGLMRDFLFEDKGCTMICCWGCVAMSEFDVLRSILFALEALAALASLKEKCKIGISYGNCFTGVCGHIQRRDFVVMGTEVNMAARLVAKAEIGKIVALLNV
jgi:class 3 adenylate cyclase